MMNKTNRLLVSLTIFSILFTGCGSEKEVNKTHKKTEDEEIIEEVIEEKEEDDTIVDSLAIDTFIDQFNRESIYQIENSYEIDIRSDEYREETDYKRTEFRLRAFDGAIAKRGFINDHKIEIVYYNSPLFRKAFRVYFDADSDDNLAIEVFNRCLKISNLDLTEDEIKEEDEELMKHFSSNLTPRATNGSQITYYYEKELFMDDIVLKNLSTHLFHLEK